MTGPHLVHAVMSADAAPDLASLHLAGLQVIEGARLSVVTDGRLAALVSVLRAGASDSLFVDSESAARVAVEHHSVLTRLAALHDLAPVRLGAMYADVPAVQAMLRETGPDFQVALTRIAGAVEFAVKLTPVDGVADTAAPVMASTGRSYLKGKADQAAARRSSAERARKAATEAFETVSVVALDRVFASPRRNAQADQEKRLLDAALLVSRSAFGAFEAAVLAAQEIAGSQGYQLTVTGPLPPYSFVGMTGDRESAA
jgi:hypothetical protein